MTEISRFSSSPPKHTWSGGGKLEFRMTHLS